MDFDRLLVNYLGELGKYQLFILLFVSSASINSCINNLDYIFTGATPSFRCSLQASSQLTSNLSFDELSQLMSPVTPNGDPDPCHVYKYNYSSLTVEDVTDILQSLNRSQMMTEKCNSWIFNHEELGSTVVTEWSLVCDKEWFVVSSQAAYMAGFFTAIIGGSLADRFGRRPVALGCMVFVTASRCLLALSPNIYVLIASRFLLSTATINWYVVTCVIAMESVGPNKRTLAGQSPYFYWSIGYMILPAIAYLIRDWRTRNFVFLIFTVPFALHFCFLPESVRWLTTQGRFQEAFDVIRSIARVNKKDIPENLQSDLNKSEGMDTKQEKTSWSSLFRSRVFIKITLIEIFVWMCVSAVYYGLIFYLPELGGSIYLSTLISGALEIPALLYVQLTLDTRLGRRCNAFLLFFIAGVVLIVLIVVPTKKTWLRVTLALTGRFAISAVYSITYISTAEIFPTKMRTIGLSVCSSASRFGAVISPYLAKLNKFATFLPPLLFGSLSVMAAVLFLLLPETQGKALEDFTLQNASEPRKSGYREMKDQQDETEMDHLVRNDFKGTTP